MATAKLNKEISINRIVSFFVIALIAFSVFIQLIFLIGKFANLSSSPWYLFALGWIYLVFPATLFAFFGFIRYAYRFFKNKNVSYHLPIVYLVIAVMPFTISKIKPKNHETEETVLLSETDNPTNITLTPYGVTSDYVYSKDYLAGQALAKANQPEWASNCPIKSLDYAQGCFHYYHKNIRSGALYDGKHEGVTTAICQREMNYFRDVAELDYKSNPRGFQSYLSRTWSVNMEKCETYDRTLETKLYSSAYTKLSTLFDNVKNNQVITQKDKTDVIHDLSEVSKMQYETKLRDFMIDYAGQFLDFIDKNPQLVVAETTVLPKNQTVNIELISDKNKAIHAELDQLQKQNVGLVDISKEKNQQLAQTLKAIPLLRLVNSKTDFPEHYLNQDPDSMNVGMDEQEHYEAQLKQTDASHGEKNTSASLAEQNNQRSADRLTAGLDAAKDKCGGQLDDFPNAGMSEARSIYCTVYSRTSYVHQVVKLKKDYLSAKLYILSGAKIYIINNVVTGFVRD